MAKVDMKAKGQRDAYDKHMKEQRARGDVCPYPDKKPTGYDGCKICGAMVGEGCMKGKS